MQRQGGFISRAVQSLRASLLHAAIGRLSPLRHWSVALAAVFWIGLLAMPTAASARDGYVSSFDGTHIVYSFFPAANLKPQQRAPTVMIGPGWSSSRDKDPNSKSDLTFGSVGIGPLRAAGYNVLTWDPRGFGDSSGTVEVDSPSFEARDVQSLIDFIAKQPEAQLDGPRDPRVGMSGVSYGGGIQLVSAAIDRRIDAITPTIAWHSLVTSLDKNQTAKGGWGSALFGLGVQGSTAGGITGGLMGEPNGFVPPRSMDPHVTDAYQKGLQTGKLPDDDVKWFASHGPGDLVRNIHAPTLLVQGTVDTLFTLQEADQNYAMLRQAHTPVKMLWFCGGHGACLTGSGPDPLFVQNAVLSWFDRYLKENAQTDTGSAFRWISDTGAIHSSNTYPPPGGRPITGSGSGTLALVPADTSGGLIAAGFATNAVNIGLQTPTTPTQMLGSPLLRLNYRGSAAPAEDRVYAQLVDDQTHMVLDNLTTPVPILLDGKPHALTIPLESVAIDTKPGSHYSLQITDGSNVYFGQRSAGSVRFSKAAVSVPTLAPDATR
jgi:ABC-2 type transport system ATP-binding protein